MNEDFKYIVTPAAYDIKVAIAADAPWKVDRVYGATFLLFFFFFKKKLNLVGSPGHADNGEGVLCEVNSIFPSQKESEMLTKGGVVVVKLHPLSPDASTLPLVYDFLFSMFFLFWHHASIIHIAQDKVL